MTFNEARKAAGLTQQALADEIGCDTNLVSVWCYGRKVSPKHIVAAKKALAKHGVEWGPEVCPCCGRAL